MNRLKILVMIGIITAFCSNFAWAGSIDVVDVDENRNALVDVTLCGERTIDDSKAVSSGETFATLAAIETARAKDASSNTSTFTEPRFFPK